jgi:hypothetical protein
MLTSPELYLRNRREREPKKTNHRRLVKAFSTEKGAPRTLLTPSGLMIFQSNPLDVEESVRALAKYMGRPFAEEQDDLEHDYGRSIWTEILTATAIQRTFKEFSNAGLQLILSPTSMDHSVKQPKGYQKGVDMLLVVTVKTAFGYMTIPVCGIDVTRGGRAIVASKNILPAVQLEAGIPTVAVGFGNLNLDVNENAISRPMDSRFRGYIDYAAEAYIRDGVIDPFCLLTPSEEEHWQHLIALKTYNGLLKVDETIDFPASGFENVSKHPNIPIIRNKARYMLNMVTPQANTANIMLPRWQSMKQQRTQQSSRLAA